MCTDKLQHKLLTCGKGDASAGPFQSDFPSKLSFPLTALERLFFFPFLVTKATGYQREVLNCYNLIKKITAGKIHPN